MTIPIYKPFLPPASLKYAHEALDSTWISSQGKYIQMMQDRLQELLNVKYVLPLNNGTSACHLLAKILFKKLGENNKYQIIVPNNVYVAAWNAFLFDNRFTLIPIDADINTWNIDLQQLDEKIKQYPEASVLIVHNIGNIINVPELQRKYPNTYFVEDNCEGFLGKYENEWSGVKSLCAAVSCFGNKTLVSGEGGFISFQEESLYNYAKSLHGQGQTSQKFVHDLLGYNYRITNVQAAIYYGQLDIMDQILDMKSVIFEKYRNFIKNREDVFAQSIDSSTQHSNWMFGVRIPKQKNYSEAEQFFKNKNIETRPMFYPISTHKHLQNNSDVLLDNTNMTNAEILNKTCLILPSFPELSIDEQNHILETLENYINSI